MSGTNIAVGIRGSLYGHPLTASVKYGGGAYTLKGILLLKNALITDVLPFIDDGLGGDELALFLNKTFGRITTEIDITHSDSENSFRIVSDEILISAIKKGGGSAIVIMLDDKPAPADAGFIPHVLSEIKKLLNISEMTLLFKKGAGIDPNTLVKPVKNTRIPKDFSSYECILAGKFSFGDNFAGKAVKELFGASETSVFIAADATHKQYSCAVSIPDADTKYVRFTDMFVGINIKTTGITFKMKGVFAFKFLKDTLFLADCEFSPNVFMVAAEMQTKDSIEIFPGFSVSSTLLMIGMSPQGIMFAMITTLNIRKLSLFSGIMLTTTGNTTKISLITAAIEKLSVPVMLENIAGISFPGMETLDVVSVEGFKEIKTDKPFDIQWMKNGNVDAAAGHFNAYINDKRLTINVSQTSIRPFGTGYALSDNEKMRHYFIDSKGSLSLQAQFYYSDMLTPLTIGSYTISAGIFISGTVKLFNFSFTLLFSLRQGEGLTAFAKIDRIDLGFLVIASSGSTVDLLPIPKNSLAKQFIPEKNDGLIFFLTAGKNEISFYFDGSITLLKLFKFAARIMYLHRTISIYATFPFFIFKATLQLEVSYENFTKAQFSFRFVLDSKGVEDALKSVSDRLDKAIALLREKINNFQESLKQAQRNVDMLYNEISSLRNSINACRAAIDSANWYSKAAVAIAKGLEIAAYEIAILGVYGTIALANAALELISEAVSLAGEIGEDILDLVKTTVDAATSLLYIRRIEITAAANPQNLSFSTHMYFKALGRDYSLAATYSADVFKNNPAKALADSVLNRMDADIKAVEAGEPLPPQNNVYLQSIMSLDENRNRLNNSMKEIDRNGKILKSMQEEYTKEFGRDNSEYQNYNVSYSAALSTLGSSLNTASRVADIEKLSMAVNRLNKKVMTIKKASKIKDAALKKRSDALLTKLNNLNNTKTDIHNTYIKTIQAQRDIEEFSKVKKPEEKAAVIKKMPRGDMSAYLDKLEEIIKSNSSDEDTGFINLAREPKIEQLLNERKMHFGGVSKTKAKKAESAKKVRFEYISRL